MSDSQVFVAERRENGEWVRVAVLARPSVRTVERRVTHAGADHWLTEDVRTTAGLAPQAHAAGPVAPAPRRPRRGLRPSRTTRQGETR